MIQKVLERFLHYITFDTASDYNSLTIPSTDKQMALAEALLIECRNLGFGSVTLTDAGYIYCYLKGNEPKGESIGFIAHMDTSPDCKGSDIKAQIIKNYNGTDIKLGENLVLSPSEFKTLKKYIGWDIITTGGGTLLGADNKAGIAEIMTAMEYIIKNNVKRPDIYVAFTPDEEVGRGMDDFDLERFKPSFAFTVDGEAIGEIEYESFNAARARITIKGRAIHPGCAKGIMKNAVLLANEFIGKLPAKETPAETEGYEGFFHVNSLSGTVESAEISLLVRDFDKDSFSNRKKRLADITKCMNDRHGERVMLSIKDEYSNMGEVIKEHMWLIDTVMDVCRENNIEPVIKPIRGGTDGSRLSFMGIPCPNLFTGGHNFHGPYEYIPVQSMEKAVDVIIGIIQKFAEI